MPRGNTYTEEHINFLREYSPSHTLDEIWEAFFDKFEMDISKASIQYLVTRYDIPHVSRKGLAGKNIKDRGSEKTKYRRSQIKGSEELFNLMEDVCNLFDMKKYEFCGQAITTFLKNEDSISWDLRSKKYPDVPKYINIDIPVNLEETIKEVSIKNGCSVNILITQALINYGVSRLPAKADIFKHVITIDSNSLNGPTPDVPQTNCKSNRHRWTKKEIEYIRNLARTNTFDSLLNRCNKEFNFVVTEASLRTQMSRNNIYTGIKESTGKKSKVDKNFNSSKTKEQKYYVNGMEELNIHKSNESNSESVTTTDSLPLENLNSKKMDATPLNPNPSKTTVIKKERELPVIPKEKTSTTPKEKTSGDKKYVIPQDLPKIIERVRKLTSASRFEISNCAVRYYLSKKWHVDKRLKIAKYYDISWLNNKFVQPIVITLDMINQLDKVANEFNCKISTVILQAYLDYSSKIFEDCEVEFKYVFESDLTH